MELEESVRSLREFKSNRLGIKNRQNKKHTPQKHRLSHAKQSLNMQSILIRGDIHTRHIAGLTKELVDSSTSVTGVCKPGARLLDIVSLPQLAPPPASNVGLDHPESSPIVNSQ
ncbi:hypothetical protein J6590_069052 [Homalodisca vitripennis]|nr:hypothetical protein J6590_069052 [Homalodisca vitripennis]